MPTRLAGIRTFFRISQNNQRYGESYGQSAPDRPQLELRISRLTAIDAVRPNADFAIVMQHANHTAIGGADHRGSELGAH